MGIVVANQLSKERASNASHFIPVATPPSWCLGAPFIRDATQRAVGTSNKISSHNTVTAPSHVRPHTFGLAQVSAAGRDTTDEITAVLDMSTTRDFHVGLENVNTTPSREP